jgi:ABC-type bacteriocin/lantibiotic exporter with double-glycine peptidase domain
MSVPGPEKSLLDPGKVAGNTIVVHLALQVFLTVASTLAFFIVLGFVLWRPNVYVVIVDVVLSPTMFVVMRYFFPAPGAAKKKTTPKKQ